MRITSPDSTRSHRRLAQTFVNLSQAYRDLVLDFSIALFRPKDVRVLRNRIQGVVRALLGLRHDTKLFELAEESGPDISTGKQAAPDDFVVDIEKQGTPETTKEYDILRFVASNLAEPTNDLVSAIRSALQSCDAVLMDMCGHRRYLGPPTEISGDIAGSLVKLRKQIIAFSGCQDSVLASDKLPPVYAEFPEVCTSGRFSSADFILISHSSPFNLHCLTRHHTCFPAIE